MIEGTYKYFLNGKPTGIIETFHRELLSDGVTQTGSERDASIFGTTISVTTREKNGKFQAAEIIFKKTDAEVKALYKFGGNSFNFQREINGELTDNEVLDLPENAEFFPLMRVFQAHTILKVAANKNFTIVIVPDIQNPADAETLLKPTFDERAAEFIGDETLAFYQDSSVGIDVKTYRYISKHYDENAQFWLNEDGILVGYRFAQAADKVWEIFLEEAFTTEIN